MNLPPMGSMPPGGAGAQGQAPLTAEERQALEEAWKDPKIRQQFEEKFGAELQQWRMQQGQASGGGPRSEKVTPNPGFVIKTKTLETNEKVFINLCSSERVKSFSREPQPPTAADPDPPDRLRIPLSLGPVNHDTDKTGSTCLVYDIIMNPEVVEAARTTMDMQRFVVDLCLSWIEEKSGGGLDRRYSLPRLRNNYKGDELRSQTIRGSALVEELPDEGDADNIPNSSELPSASASRSADRSGYGYGETSSYGNFEYSSGLPQCYVNDDNSGQQGKEFVGKGDDGDGVTERVAEVPSHSLSVQRRVADVLTRVPYGEDSESDALEQDESAEALVLSIEMPLLKKATQAQVDVMSDKIVLNAASLYSLEVKFPVAVDDRTAEAAFDRKRKVMTVTLPIAAHVQRMIDRHKQGNEPSKSGNASKQGTQRPAHQQTKDQPLHGVVSGSSKASAKPAPQTSSNPAGQANKSSVKTAPVRVKPAVQNDGTFDFECLRCGFVARNTTRRQCRRCRWVAPGQTMARKGDMDHREGEDSLVRKHSVRGIEFTSQLLTQLV